MKRSMVVLGLAATLTAAPAAAQSASGDDGERDFCPTRPSLGSSACITLPGRVTIETGIADWTIDKQPDEREDTVLLGDTLARIGLTNTLEAQVGWTPYGHVRTRDRMTGAIEKEEGVGDLSLGARWNLRNPDGKGFAVALQPAITLPTGGHAIGSGTWGAELVVPVTYELTDSLQVALSPEVDAEPDEDRAGRHLRYGSVVTFSLDVSKQVTVNAELSDFRDHDPEGHETELVAATSIGWQPVKDLQLDAGINIGLNRASPDAEPYFGISHRF